MNSKAKKKKEKKIHPKFLNKIKLDMMRKEPRICLILQNMFRIHYPSVANTD